ncbi:FecR domain-containing protein [[Pseudomonas] boreopolis]|uniref:FecR family protein n=1 Tax=Xanthomonas boreopolis TaxID=86183 RepID=UPI003D9FC35E
MSMPVQAADWNYRVRPGDTLWDLSARYLKPDVPWQRLGSFNAVADPYALPPGRTLRFPIPWLRVQPAPARLIAVRGGVQVLTGHVALPATTGMPLQIGAQLQTGPDASATVEFADGSQMQLRESTRVRFDRMSRYGATGMVDTEVRLETGRLLNEVAPARGPASRYIIDTPNGSSSVRGTRFRVAAGADDGRGATEVLHGVVQVESGKAQHLLRPGQAARQGAASAPQQEPLLPAPVFDAAASRLDTPPFRLAWAPVPGASGYRIEAVEAERPQVLRYARETTQPSLQLDGLEPGQYRLLVRAITDYGIEGEDAVHALDVAATPTPPLTIAPLADAQVHQPQPRFEWTRHPDAAATRLQVAHDEAFADLVFEQDVKGVRARAPQPLPPGNYYWRVASRAAEGHLGPFGQPLALQVSDAPVDPGLAPENEKGRLTLRWQAGAPGQRYRVQLARKPDFARPKLDEVVDQPQVSLKRPWGGTWYVRVQTLDDDGYAAPFSEPQQIALRCYTCYGIAGGSLLLLLAL